MARDGPLPITDALSVLRDVARALEYAHEHGVVHRDIKPDNVMMSGGAAVVTDFGIAKARQRRADRDAPDAHADAGRRGIGTPAYMAPEQAVGDPARIIGRTSIRSAAWPTSCSTGKPPFHDLPTHQIIGGAHVGTVPALVSEVRADVPESVGPVGGPMPGEGSGRTAATRAEALAVSRGAPRDLTRWFADVGRRGPCWSVQRSPVSWWSLPGIRRVSGPRAVSDAGASRSYRCGTAVVSVGDSFNATWLTA